MRVFKWLFLALAVAAGATTGAAEQPKAAPSPKPSAVPSPAAPSAGPFGALKLRYIGPEGNRVSAVAGVPGDPSVYYAGAASGGIFKTTDGGVNWRGRSSTTSRSRRSGAGRGSLRSQRGLGGDGRGVHPQQHLGSAGACSVRSTPAAPGRAPVSRRRAGSPHRRRPARSRRRAGLRAGHRLRTAAGPRRLPHERRRQDVGEDAVRGREDRLLRPGHGSQQSARPVRGDVAARDPHLGPRERGPRERDVPLERRRRHLEAGRRQRPASEAVGQGRPGHDACELGPRLRARSKWATASPGRAATRRPAASGARTTRAGSGRS